MAGVGEADVRHIASLARLGLAPERIDQMARELNDILAHMDVLARIDTSQVPHFAAERLDAMPLRADDGGASTPLRVPLSDIAPDLRDGFFLVPRLATHEDDGEQHA